MTNIKTAIGLMSGTSIDGIDISLVKSDGEKIFSKELNDYYPYDRETKNILRSLINDYSHSLGYIKDTELLITKKHIEVVENFIKKYQILKNDVDIIGFSGHTILHSPEKSITWQIGNCQLLASKTLINVVGDFRTKDVVNNGQGAPLVPIYHHAIFNDYPIKPLIILNIGGVSNITYLEDNDYNNIVAYDICFGNAPMDDLVHKSLGKDFDKDGNMAKNGKINEELANFILNQDYFFKSSPKSLDRNHFNQLLNKELLNSFANIKLEDALKTMCYIIAKSLEISIKTLKNKPKEVFVCGGGRKNKTIMNLIAEICNVKVTNVDDIGLDGNSIESQAFAFLAIRHLKNLPITFKKTTGVLLEKHNAQILEEECFSSCGGVFYRA